MSDDAERRIAERAKRRRRQNRAVAWASIWHDRTTGVLTLREPGLPPLRARYHGAERAMARAQRAARREARRAARRNGGAGSEPPAR